jgi:uncharacterized protein (TIGR02246 family)
MPSRRSFTDDGSCVGFDGSMMNGRTEIASILRGIFEHHPTASYVAKVRELRAVAPGVAIIRAVVGMVPPGTSELKPDVNAIQSLVVVENGPDAKIALLQNTPAAFHGRPELAQQLTSELTDALRTRQLVTVGPSDAAEPGRTPVDDQFHDHFVCKFSVNADTKRLSLRTSYPRAPGPYFAEGTFEGVEAYVMVGDALGTIIFDIKEVDSLSLYDEFSERLSDGYRQGGHAPWVETREEAELYCRSNEIKGYSVTSSIGFTAAIWARSFIGYWRSAAPGDPA